MDTGTQQDYLAQALPELPHYTGENFDLMTLFHPHSEQPTDINDSSTYQFPPKDDITFNLEAVTATDTQTKCYQRLKLLYEIIFDESDMIDNTLQENSFK